MADDRRFALDHWVADGLRDARTIARYPTLRSMLREAPARHPQGPNEHLGELLRDAVSEQAYRSIGVLDATGSLVQRTTVRDGIGPHALASAGGKVLHDCACVVDVIKSADGSQGVLFAAPVPAGREGARCVGAVVLDADPKIFLLPLLTSEPAPTATGETMLARRESGDAVFLDQPRLNRAGPLDLRRPLDAPSFAMRAALAGEERFGRFTDYRGAQVLAATRRLKEAPWGLVVKVDLSEALLPHARRMRAEARWGGLVGLVLGGFGLALWKWRRAASEARLQAGRARTALLLDQANDVILLIGPDGRILEANKRAEEFYNAAERPLVGRPVSELRAQEERAESGAQLQQALGGSIRFETVHVRSDGTRVPVEVSSRAVVLEGRTTLVSVVRDVSERKGWEARLERINRLYKTLSEVNQLIVRAVGRPALLEGVCRTLADVGRFPLVWLGLKRGDGTIEVAARSGPATRYLDGIEVRWDDGPLGSGPTGLAVREGRAVVLRDLSEDPSFEAWRDRAAEHGLQSSGAFPVVVAGDTIGALTIYASQPDALGPQEQELVSELAGDLGFALELAAATAERRSLEERLRAIFEGGLIGILFGDIHGRVFDANDAFLDLIGYTRDDLRSGGVRWDAITPPEHRPADEKGVAEAREHGSCVPYEKEYVRKDGRRVCVLVGFVLLEPERERSVAFIVDISQLRRTENALAESEARMRAIVETAVDGVVTIDEAGLVESFNPAAERLFGYSAMEVLGRNVSVLMPSPHQERHDGYIARYLATGEGRIIGAGREVAGRRKDGTEFPIDLAVAEFKIGTKRAFAGIIHDLTPHRQLEAQFLQAQKMEAVGRLAGGVAHDFNNLLGVITGYSEMALRQLGEGHAARPKLAQVLKAAEGAAGLTRQLLAFSRRQVLDPRAVDLNGLVQDLEKMLRRLIGEDVELEVRLGPDLGAVRVDPGQMEQVVMNLAVNARDAMPRGGGLTIETAEAADAEFRARAHWQVAPGEYVRLSVSDTGLGMDDLTRAQIFEPFFTTKPPGKGTGLGLATVYGVVKQSGGHVFVESEVGRGTRFSIFLPRVVEGPVAIPVLGGAEHARAHETILLVEDQESLREVIGEMLWGLGYHVLLAGDADTAAKVAAEHDGDIDLLLSDVVMPRVSGPELAERVALVRPGIRVLFMSGYTSDVLSRQGVSESEVEIVEKPFTRQVLSRRIRRILSSEG
jgi:PAS domain S-box-containing protein